MVLRMPRSALGRTPQPEGFEFRMPLPHPHEIVGDSTAAAVWILPLVAQLAPAGRDLRGRVLKTNTPVMRAGRTYNAAHAYRLNGMPPQACSVMYVSPGYSTRSSTEVCSAKHRPETTFITAYACSVLSGAFQYVLRASRRHARSVHHHDTPTMPGTTSSDRSSRSARASRVMPPSVAAASSGTRHTSQHSDAPRTFTRAGGRVVARGTRTSESFTRSFRSV